VLPNNRLAGSQEDAGPWERSTCEIEAADEWLDDRESLDAFYAEHGYLYLREVLDTNAVAELRKKVVDVLERHGIVSVDGPEPRWTGTDPMKTSARAELDSSGHWEAFVEHPAIAACVERVMGDAPFYIGTAVYRFMAPTPSPPFPHQDGFLLPGVPFMGFWIPLMDVDETLGGLTLADGSHKRGWLPKIDPAAAMTDDPKVAQRGTFYIERDAVADDSWCRAVTYRAGDLLVLHPQLLHTGLANRTTDRVRLSIDIRAQRASAPRTSGALQSSLQTQARGLESMRVLSQEGVPENRLHDVFCELFARDTPLDDRPAVRRVIAEALT